MSLTTYILENCKDTLRYRVHFNSTTHLNVGEIGMLNAMEYLRGAIIF